MPLFVMPAFVRVLDVGGEFLDGQRVGVQHIERLTAGHFPDGVLIQRRQLCPQKLLAQQLTSPPKAPPDEGRILYRAADIHGKADERLVVPGQQLLLILHPALPCIQHLDQRNSRFHVFLLSAVLFEHVHKELHLRQCSGVSLAENIGAPDEGLAVLEGAGLDIALEVIQRHFRYQRPAKAPLHHLAADHDVIHHKIARIVGHAVLIAPAGHLGADGGVAAVVDIKKVDMLRHDFITRHIFIKITAVIKICQSRLVNANS